MYAIEYDELGPHKVLNLYFPKTGVKAFVAVDNVAMGPSIGGVRVSPSVTLEEVIRLARAMTLKNSMAGLPHGGGKAGIVADPEDPRKEQLIRMFAKAIKDLKEYIPGPDMGTNETCMAWVHDEIERAVGLPKEIGGIPLDQLGATGFGLSECAEVACPVAGVELKGSRIAVHGYGSVGKAAVRFLAQKGASIVAVADSKGSVYQSDGLDIKILADVKAETGSVVNYPVATVVKADELFAVDCDIIIPAATADVIHIDNVDRIKAKMILQGANIPVTREAETILHQKGVLSIPDFVANSGGVTMAAMEYAGKYEKEAFDAISIKIKNNTEIMLKRCTSEKRLPREVAEEIARERVLRAMQYRRF